MAEKDIPTHVPNVTFVVHEYGKGGETPNPNVCDAFIRTKTTTDDLFKGKKVVLFSLPGAFTPVCSSAHLPAYEEKFDEFKALGIDDIMCLSVNDPFVMHEWGKHQGVKNITLLPDGSGEFTKGMGMLVKKENLGFGERSWRYSMYVDDGEIKKIFVEPGFSDNCGDDPLEVSDAGTILEYLKSNQS